MTDQRMLDKVRALIARADHPLTPPAEAEACRAKADALMFKYKIDALTAQPGTQAAPVKPVWLTVPLCRAGSEWTTYFSALASTVVYSVGCRAVTSTEMVDGQLTTVINVVGFEGDVQYIDVILTSALLAFSKRLEPTVNREESEAENALRLRQGGMERRRIAVALFGSSDTENEQKAKNRKVTNLIKAEAARIGQPELADSLLGRGTNIKTYRASYAEGFYTTLDGRLRRHNLDKGAESGGLVLASFKERVDEAFYERYPSLRPSPAAPQANTGKSYTQEQRECARCKAAKSGYCREHNWMKPRAYKERAFSTAAYSAGQSAAREVDLGAGATGKVQGHGARAIG